MLIAIVLLPYSNNVEFSRIYHVLAFCSRSPSSRASLTVRRAEAMALRPYSVPWLLTVFQLVHDQHQQRFWRQGSKAPAEAVHSAQHHALAVPDRWAGRQVNLEHRRTGE
jgi:hypothetical protein